MQLRWRALKLGLSSLALAGLVLELAPGCGGDTGGLAPSDDSGSETGGETGEGGVCASGSFVTPADKAKLGVADDTSGKKCADGLVTDVTVATTAPDGTKATLFANDKEVGSATAASAKLVFTKVAFPSKGAVALKVQIGTDATCVTTASITVDCGLPLCTIAAPKGPYLNGRPAADGGDRANAATDPFATKVDVTTDIEDGQTVTLTVDGIAPVKATASGGKASFASVTMAPDGVHVVNANCTNATGNTGGSGPTSYTVLTAPVNLTMTSPAAGKSFGVADDIDSATPGVQFKVCGTTTTAAAIDVPADARVPKNFCAGLGTGTPTCTAMTAAAPPASGGSSCITVTCPDGSAPFDIGVVLNDKAGNQAKATVAGVHCESKLPSVQIVAPVAYSSTDATTILNLAAGDTGSAAGALKKTVVACTDKAGSKAQLNVGKAGGTLVATGAPVDVVAAIATDKCPTGLGFVAKFPGVILSESDESKDGKGTLVTATEIRVDVTDSASNLGKSPNVDLWVDSVPPGMSMTAPGCGKTYSATATVTDSVKLVSDTIPMTFKVIAGATTDTYPIAAFDTAAPPIPNTATLSSVKFYVGNNKLSLTATDAAGNAAEAFPSCTTFVGTPPIIAITAPSDGAVLGNDSNVDAATHKYKATVSGTVTGTTDATTVTLKLGGTVAGTAPITSGAYSFSGALLPESDALTISVELSDSKYGTISKSETVIVDTHPPSMSGALTAAVNAAKRRAGGVDLTWPAATDFDPITGGTRGCNHYELRRASTAITSEATYSAATVYTPAPSGSATTTTVTGGRLPQTDFFAIRCFDKANNPSSFVTNASAAVVDYIESTLPTPAGLTSTDGFGRDAWGTADFNGDTIPDLVVAAGNSKIYVYFGIAPGAAGYPGYPSTPTVIFTGSGLFGYGVSELDDFDGDGKPDLAVAAPLAGANGTVWIISGKAVTPSSSEVAVTTLGTNVESIVGGSGISLVGLGVWSAGNFDGDGGKKTDVAVAAGYTTGHHGFTVVAGQTINGGTITIPTGGILTVESGQPPASSQFVNQATAQDLDVDGFTDLVTGDHYANKIYVFKGRAATSPAVQVLTVADSAFAQGGPTGSMGDDFGFSLSLPGPIFGSGIDLLVGAFGFNSHVGQVYALKGSGLSFGGGALLTHVGATGPDQLGRAVIRVPPGRTFDLDKDGHADVLGCTATTGPSTSPPGRCYLQYGVSLASAPDWRAVNAPKSFVIEQSSTDPGLPLMLGDIDNDGFDDIAICSPGTQQCRIER